MTIPGFKGISLRNNNLNANLGTGTPPQFYWRLYKTMPDPVAGGGTEVTGTGYAPVLMLNNSTNFPPTTTGEIDVATALVFTVSAGSLWAGPGDEINWLVLAGSNASVLSPSDIFYVLKLTAALIVNPADPVSFNAGTIKIFEV